MRRGAWLALAAAALLQTQLAAWQIPTGGKQPPADAQAAKRPIRPGERGHVTLSIGGTSKPTRVKVRNRNSAIVTLDAGDEQTVMSSGGDTNSVTIALTGVSSGTPDFEVTVDTDEPPAVFQKTLRQIVAVTRKRLASVESLSLPPGHVTYKLDDVLALVDEVERDVVTLLPENEFAPFRDAMHTYLKNMRGQLRERAIALPRRGGGRGIVRVSTRLVQLSQRVDKEAADGWFSSLFRLLGKTAEDGLMREVCVRTKPTLYDISLTPASYSAGRQSVNAASLLSLAVGEYKVQIRAQRKNVESNTTVDFLTNPYSAIECPVKFASGDAEACKYLAGESRPCP